MSEAKVELIGRHEHRFLPPNRVYMALHGLIDSHEIEAQNGFLRKCAEDCGQRLRAICDLADFEGMTVGARRYVVRMDRNYPYIGMAFVGGSFMTRTVASTVLRAGQLLAPQHFNFPVFFGKTLEECETWLDGLQTSP
jgi:hypothetical protein